MKNNIINFIIVTWNNEDTIIDCIESIYKYSNDFNITIFDNNSSDKTIQLLKEKKYKNCYIIESKENLGFAIGNNEALKNTKTEFVCFLNPDTILTEDIIKPSINILKSNSKIGLVGCKLLNSDLSLQSSAFNFFDRKNIYYEAFRIGKFMPNIISEKYFPNDSKSKKNKFVDWVIGAEMIMYTEDAKKIGGFSTEYYMYTEDMDLCKKIYFQLNKKVYLLNDVSLIHIGGVSESKNTNYKKMEKLIDNKITFAQKFYNNKQQKKIKKSLYNSYKIRYILVYMFVYNKKTRKKYLDKMMQGMQMTKKYL